MSELRCNVPELTDKLLDLIYDAASDETLWTPALGEITDEIGGLGSFMFGVENKQRIVTFTYNARMSDESHRIYRERHFINPWTPYMNRCGTGRLVQSDEILSLRDLRKTSFFNEVLDPQDLAHNAMLVLAAQGDFQVGFNLCRNEDQGTFDANELRFLMRLYPHLRRSLLLNFRLEGYRALQQAQHDVLDRLSAGFVLLDRRARIIYANAAAQAFDSQFGPLRLRNSVIATHSSTSSQRLNALIRAALKGAPAGSMSLPLRDQSLLTILVVSIRGQDIGRLSDGDMRDAAVLIVIIDPANRTGVPMAWMMDAYGLTQAEARVALAAASGSTVPESASQLGLSSNTVKTHLRKVFAKTGIHRQTELVRLVTAIGLLRDKTKR
jgi:DNA-binding CsgD family transcriptional regulator/PAS domain-containing protein